MQTDSPVPQAEDEQKPVLRLLLALAGILAILIFTGAALSPAYFSAEPLYSRALAIFMGVGDDKTIGPELLQIIASYTGMCAGVLAATFGLLLLLKAWNKGPGQLLAMALILGAFGFSLLHFFPFVPGEWASNAILDKLTQCAGLICVVVAALYWARWSSQYPQQLSVLELRSRSLGRYKRSKIRKGGFSALNRGMRNLIVMDMRFSRKISRKLRISIPIFRSELESSYFIQRINTNKWLYIVIAATFVISSLKILLVDTIFYQGVFAFELSVMIVYFMLIIGVSQHCLEISYARADEADRRKIIWLWYIPALCIAIFTILLFLSVLLFLTGQWPALAANLFFSMFLFPIALGLSLVLSIIFSTLVHGTVDPRLAITRTTLYGVIAVLMTSLFVVIEAVMSMQAVLHLNLPSHTGAITTAVAAALMFGPVRNRVESKVERWIRGVLPASHLVEGDKRRSAVTFNDLSGYTDLSGKDERQALMIAAVFHREAYVLAAKHSGRVVKTIGDAAMMEFASVSDAVQALQELHKNFAEACRRVRIDPLPVHSGVHVGEVFRAHDGDIYGQSVNLASRLEGAAGPNDIVISEAAWLELQEREGFLEMGPCTLKNVPEPVNCYHLPVMSGA